MQGGGLGRHLEPTTLSVLPVAPVWADVQPVVFKKVDVFETEGDDEKKRDARLELHPEDRMLLLVDEKKGADRATYAAIPYDAIEKIVYERASHRRYKSGLLLSPWLLFSKGKKHWLTIEFDGVATLPQGFVYARLDKKNFRQILSALEAGTNIEVEELIED